MKTSRISQIISQRNLIKKVDDLLMVNCNEMTEDITLKFWDEMVKQECITELKSFIVGSGDSVIRLWVDMGQNGVDTWQRFKKEIGVSKSDINQMMKLGIISDKNGIPFFDDGTCFIDIDLEVLISVFTNIESDASVKTILGIVLGERDEINESIKLLRNNLK